MTAGRETAFEMAVGSIRFGAGVTREVGADLADRGIRRALIVTDPVVARLEPVGMAIDSLDAHQVEWTLYDRVSIEPTERSWKDAIQFASSESWEAVVAVGGGSSIDTAKAVNLYVCHPPGDFFDYVNLPIGRGLPVPGPLKPLFAIPTTAGTGSETTGVAVLDVESRHVKTGLSSRLLKPTLGLLDPSHTRTLPPAVAASAGLDILCHAVESYTAVPFTERPASSRPSARPPYQGANPISDVWSLQALRTVATHLVRVVDDPDDDEARGNMLLAAAYAGIGFGNAGVHLPHAMAYPVAGGVRDYRAPGYPADHPLVPHGFSVVLNLPAVVRFMAEADPARHLAAAEALGADVSGCAAADAGRVLADRVTWFMERVGVPKGLRAVGYSITDIPQLVEGTLAQERLTTLAPRAVDDEALARIFEEALAQ